MTPEELTAKEAELKALETEAAITRQALQDYRADALRISSAVREGVAAAQALRDKIKPLAAEIDAHNDEENKRKHSEAVAAAEAKRAEEAAKPKEKTEVEKLRDEIAELKELVKAKG